MMQNYFTQSRFMAIKGGRAGLVLSAIVANLFTTKYLSTNRMKTKSKSTCVIQPR